MPAGTGRVGHAMRRHGGKLAMALAMAMLAATPALAACPPAGQDTASLQALKAGGFEVADATARETLALGLVA